MLAYSHDYLLVAASLAISLMAGFTGLSLTRGASRLPVPRRKLVVALAAIALGGGVWSMHFVAMLGLELPILFYYDPLVTLISALIAILILGVALLMVHFGRRTRTRILAAGAVVGLGIPAMHYAGMSGMELCRPVYSPSGIAVALLASILLGVGAFWIAYGKRGPRNIILGTIGFGVAVFAVHFIAMAGTGFVAVADAVATGPRLSNDTLALGVTLSAFVISGAFLLTSVSFNEAEEVPAAEAPAPAVAASAEPPRPEPAAAPATAAPARPPVRIPFEKEGRTQFVDPSAVAAIRAEGHYTILYVGAEKLFCPWSITETEARVGTDAFMRTHRSYLVNPRHVTGFERMKDTGVCYFDGVPSLGKVPVSRSRLNDVRAQLGL